MLVSDFEIIITKPFPAALMLSPFGLYGDILELVYTTPSCGAMAFCHKNSARHRFGGDKMFNFTKTFNRTQTNSFSMV